MPPFAQLDQGARAVYVVAVAYGSYRVRRHGHASLIDWVSAAGATGLEVRAELFPSDPPRELETLAKALAEAKLRVLYSAPDPLCDTGGEWRLQALQTRLAEAQALGAQALKLPLGRPPQAMTVAACAPLKAILAAASAIRLSIENDQTISGGQLALLSEFFYGARAAALPLGMTFDMGNWLWPEQDPSQAAAALVDFVEYVHVKSVAGEGNRRFSVPPAAEDEDFCALLRQLPPQVALGLEFPLLDGEPVGLTRHYISLLRKLSSVEPARRVSA